MYQASPPDAAVRSSAAQPGLIFFCELATSALQRALSQPLLAEMAEQGYGIALGLLELTPERAALVQYLHRHGIHVTAWLQLPSGEGLWLNLQNYPQVIERYRAFHAWARQYHLAFAAVGINIEPPPSEVARLQQWGPRDIARRLWLASENVLYAAARGAYTELIAEMHHDGYEVHAYQLPLVADDRRAGTTLIQRALDVVDLPVDVEVLMCYSSLPAERLGNDLGGALINSYGPAADAIAVGTIGAGEEVPESGELLPPLSWAALERDLLLAARHTDIIYVYSLEGCIERGLLSRFAHIDWDMEPQVALWRRASIGTLRVLLLIGLLAARFSRRMLAWLGWAIAALLFIQQIRTWRRERVANTMELP
jgi:hypothetical protein